MSFSLKQFLGHAEQVVDHDFFEELSADSMSEREKEVVQELGNVLETLGEKLGGHISISAYGHVNPSPAVGDQLVVNINAVPDPASATQPSIPDPSAVPVETPTSPATATPLEAAQPGGSTAPPDAPGTSPGLTQPPVDAPVEEPAPAAVASPDVTSSGPDLGPAATEVPAAPGDPAPASEPVAGATTPEDEAAEAQEEAGETPAPVAPDASAPPADPAAAPAPVDPAAATAPASVAPETPGAPAPDAPAAPAAPVAQEGRSVYVNDGAEAPDPSAWPLAPVETTDVPARPLYFYSGDVAPGDHNGDGQGGVWHVYQGPTQPVPGATS